MSSLRTVAGQTLGHVPCRAANPAGHVPRRGPGMGMLALCPLLGDQHWACPAELLEGSARGWEVPRRAGFAAGHVPLRGPTLDMSLAGLKTHGTCPSARARDGHIGLMSIPRDQHWHVPRQQARPHPGLSPGCGARDPSAARSGRSRPGSPGARRLRACPACGCPATTGRSSQPFPPASGRTWRRRRG